MVVVVSPISGKSSSEDAIGGTLGLGLGLAVKVGDDVKFEGKDRLKNR